MRAFKIEVTANDGTTSTHRIMAHSAWEAVDLLYYKFGMGKLQPNRRQYKEI